VVTANDYLVARDAARLAPLYTALGLRVGQVVQPDAAAARAAAYACDITYVSAKELVFDYLRDQLSASAGASQRRSDAPAAALARLQKASAQTPASSSTAAQAPALLRGLCMAIVDEADAVLIDEARVPLILSQATPLAATQEHAQQALQFARSLQLGADFAIDSAAMAAALTDAGRASLQAASHSLNGASTANAWRHAQHREHAVCMALVALHGLQNERHYLVRETQGQRGVQIIDASTGRIAEGRAWSQGLQQMVEAKEGCTPSPALATLAQLTFQRFFSRYVRLGGLSGTLSEARSELMAHYGTAVRRVPLRKPSLRQVRRTCLYKDATTLRAVVVAQVEQLHQQQRPVMVATDSVADAQALSLCLKQQALPHDLLHARNDAEEAHIVARAGQPGAITVTTNIAGRGTDIELGAGVAARGGLHVICCQLNSARRIDRQLAGRAARQGDPGSVQTLLSLDNSLLVQAYPAALRRCLAPFVAGLPAWAVRAVVRAPQWAQEQNQRLQRQRLIAQDERSERQLAFGGVFE
jgi:preprotein translocase subunit SecA